MSGQPHTDILEKIDNKLYYLTENVAGTSTVWEKFLLIKERDPDRNTGFVQCKACKKVLQHRSKTGTSNLTRHVCKNSEVLVTNNASISAEDKKNIVKSCVTYCTKDLRSFMSIGRPGFTLLAQELINFGCKYGRVSAENVLPHATTVSRHVLELADEVKNNIFPEVIDAVRRGICAATTDFWTDKYTKTSYYTVTVHYVNESWKLIERVLFTTGFPDESKTGENIRRELNRRFEIFGIPSDIVHKITFVTDQGSNIIKALETVERLNCSAHCLNSALRNAFKTESLKKHAPNTLHILETTKSIVTYLKRSGLASRLPATVHQEVETRWSSKIMMLRSVVNQYDPISEVLSEAKESSRLEDYNVIKVRQLITFLEPFEQCIDEVQADKSPTLHLVMLWLHKLLNHCETNDIDSIEIQHLKNATRNYLETKFKLHKYQKIATFLMPTFRKLRMLSTEDRIAVYSNVQELISHMPIDNTTQQASTSTATPTASTEQPRKKRLKTVFHEWADLDDHIQTSDEFSIYMSLKYMANDDILQWWKDNSHILPKLSILARKIFAIPASSASSERCFSSAGFLIQERRSSLKPEIVDAILFLHNNM